MNTKTTVMFSIVAIAAVLVLFAAGPLVTTHQAYAWGGGGLGGGLGRRLGRRAAVDVAGCGRLGRRLGGWLVNSPPIFLFFIFVVTGNFHTSRICHSLRRYG